MKKGLASFLLVFGLFFLFAKDAFAVTLHIDSINPTSVNSKDQEILVNLSITDLPSGDSYFRVGFESGNSYLGYIKNNSGDWVKLNSLTSDKDNQGCLNYFKVSAPVTSIVLSLKIGNDNDLTNGQVNLKAHRFTSTCGSNTGSDNLFPVDINLPTPTPSPSPSPTAIPSPTQNPTPTPSPTHTATPTSTPTKTLSPTLTLKPTPTLTSQPEGASDPTMTQTSTPLSLSLSPSPEVLAESTQKPSSNKFPIVAVVLLVLGIGLLGVAISPIAIEKFKEYRDANRN